MKRELNDLNLRRAFRPMPEECHRALMDAACSAKEERIVKHAPFRAVLIAALILLVTAAAAFAAQQLGWVDFYRGYVGVAVPKAGQDALNATQPIAYQVGPVTFTYRQLLADGRIGLCAADVQTTDGREVLYAADCDEIFDPMDAGDGDVVLERYGLEGGTTWVEAAQELKLPLYRVRALMDVSEEYSAGASMEAALWNENGSLVYYSMPFTNPKTAQGTLPVNLYMSVIECDPMTGEETNRWTKEVPYKISVSEMLAEKTYPLEDSITLNGLRLVSVHAEQYVTGVYLFCELLAPEGMDEETATDAVYRLDFLGNEGKQLPSGISLSGDADVDSFPTVVLQRMVSAEELPDSLTISDGTTEVTVR